MESLLLSLQGAISQGVLWGILALGVYITFRILDIADMSVDGSFVTGGSICAVLLVAGVNPFVAILLASLSGLVAGLVTGLLITIFEIPSILAGILTQLGLYSINLRIMGKANTPLLKTETIFTQISDLLGISKSMSSLIVGTIIVTLVIIFLYWFFGTEIGSTVRATGDNEKMMAALGISVTKTKIIGLMLSNGLIALAGALVTQSQGYADVNMGTGSIIIGIASIVIGEVIFGKDKSFIIRFISIIAGSIVYRIIIALVLQAGLKPDDLKLITALVVFVALSVPILLDKNKKRMAYKKLTGREMSDVKN